MKILTMMNAGGDDIPVSARIFHLVVFLLLVIFQILLVWMISTPSEDRDNWGGVFAPLFLSEAFEAVRPHPGSVHFDPAHRPGGHVRYL